MCVASAELRQKHCGLFLLAGEFSRFRLSEILLLRLCSAAAGRKLKIIVESESRQKHPVQVFALHHLQDSFVKVIILSAPAETKEKRLRVWFC